MGSAIEWAERQRRLSTEAMSPDVDPDLRSVRYQLVGRGELAAPSRSLAPYPTWGAIVSEVLHGSTGREVALWLEPGCRGCAPSVVPALVFRVAEDDPLGGAAWSGEGEAFRELAPWGALGVLVGHTMVWPTDPPRAGTAADGRRAARAAGF